MSKFVEIKISLVSGVQGMIRQKGGIIYLQIEDEEEVRISWYVHNLQGIFMYTLLNSEEVVNLGPATLEYPSD